MKLSEVKNQLSTLESVTFQLPNGTLVPEHFHVTEVGLVTKNFIDCGGTVRNETVVNFQLWDANDFEHRLKPKKLLDIITLSEKVLGIEDFEIEVLIKSELCKFTLSFVETADSLINRIGLPNVSLLNDRTKQELSRFDKISDQINVGDKLIIYQLK